MRRLLFTHLVCLFHWDIPETLKLRRSRRIRKKKGWCSRRRRSSDLMLMKMLDTDEAT